MIFFIFENLEQSEKPVILPGSSRICKMSAVGRFFGWKGTNLKHKRKIQVLQSPFKHSWILFLQNSHIAWIMNFPLSSKLSVKMADCFWKHPFQSISFPNWRSRKTPWKGHVNSPSQKGRKESPGGCLNHPLPNILWLFAIRISIGWWCATGEEQGTSSGCTNPQHDKLLSFQFKVEKDQFQIWSMFVLQNL